MQSGYNEHGPAKLITHMLPKLNILRQNNSKSACVITPLSGLIKRTGFCATIWKPVRPTLSDPFAVSVSILCEMGIQLPLPKGAQLPNFRPVSVAANWLHGSTCHLVSR